MANPANFQNVQDEYFRMRGRLATGRLTQEQFRAALKNLMIQDAQGRWWTPAEENGVWMVFDGKSWIQATPPVQANQLSASPAVTPGALRPKQSHLWLLLAGGFVSVLLVGIVLLVLVLVSSTPATPSPLAKVPTTAQRSTLPVPTPPTASANATGVPTANPSSSLQSIKIPQGNHELSQDQQIVWAMFGAPSFFMMNLAPDDAIDPVQANDYQTWYYPKRGLSYTFVNGAYAGSDDTGSVPDAAAFPSVHPLQFRKGMSLAEVQSAIGDKPIGQFQVPSSVMANTQFYKFKGIHAGFQQGELVYIETAPYLPFAANQPTSGLSEPLPASLRLIRYTPDSNPLGQPALAHPPMGGKVGFAKWLLKMLSELWSAKGKVETTGRQFSYDDMEGELKDAADFAREQAKQMRQDAKTQSDPTKAALLQQAADSGDELASALITDLLPQLQTAINNEKGKDGISWLLPPIPGLPEGKPHKVRDLLNQLLRDRNLRPGEARSNIKDWLEQLSVNWQNLPEDLRASLALDILQAKIKEQCGDPRTQERAKYDECYWRTLNWLIGEIGNWLGGGDCGKALQQLRNRTGSELAPPSPYMQLASLRLFPPAIAGEVAQSQAGTCPPRGGVPTLTQKKVGINIDGYNGIHKFSGPDLGADMGSRGGRCQPEITLAADGTLSGQCNLTVQDGSWWSVSTTVKVSGKADTKSGTVNFTKDIVESHTPIASGLAPGTYHTVYNGTGKFTSSTEASGTATFSFTMSAGSPVQNRSTSGTVPWSLYIP